jgi:hypothetical protein
MPEPTNVRRLWNMYRRGLEDLPLSRHEKKLMREAFYVGAIAMCRMLSQLNRRGETERAAEVISGTAVYWENQERARKRSRH